MNISPQNAPGSGDLRRRSQWFCAFDEDGREIVSQILNRGIDRTDRGGLVAILDQMSTGAAGREVLSVVAEHTVSYKVLYVMRPVFSLDESTLIDVVNGRPVLLVVDRNVDRIYAKGLDECSGRLINCAGKVVFDACETRKNVVEAARLCKLAADLNFPRHGILVAVGGGVTLDIVGLAASLYRRGIGYLRVPTTLVGLIDAGLGIKQAVNFLGRKNLVGAFYPPLGVINDSSFLRTLPLAEISCGIAEISKIALVKDRGLFELLEEHGKELHQSRFSEPPDIAHSILLRSAMLMIEELQPNLYETDLRRLVDFGHTFSPEIEAKSGYEIPHGYAVAMDMLFSTAIAVTRALCPNDVLTRLSTLFRGVHLPGGPPPCSLEHLAGALCSTRRHRGGDLNLVVPTAIGQATFLQDVTRGEMEEALALIGRTQVESL